MEKFDRSRRRFVGIAAAALSALPLMWRFMTPRLAAKGEVLRVARADLPAGGALVFRESRVAVVREAEGIYALSLICTHLGCTVNVTPTALVCPCHGTVFDRRGEVVKGPADRPLAHLAIEEDGEDVVVLA